MSIARFPFAVLDWEVMNQVLQNTAKQIPSFTVGIKLITFSTHDATEEERAKRAVSDIQRRATEIGPVLEEILQVHCHWRHWGLND